MLWIKSALPSHTMTPICFPRQCAKRLFTKSVCHRVLPSFPIRQVTTTLPTGLSCRGSRPSPCVSESWGNSYSAPPPEDWCPHLHQILSKTSDPLIYFPDLFVCKTPPATKQLLLDKLEFFLRLSSFDFIWGTVLVLGFFSPHAPLIFTLKKKKSIGLLYYGLYPVSNLGRYF